MRASLARSTGSVLLAAAVTVALAPGATASVPSSAVAPGVLPTAAAPASATPPASLAPASLAPASLAPRADQTPSQVLASTAWETTSAVDQEGRPVALDDPGVANYVGWAYYDADGTFTMYNLDDSPKMRGDWTVDAGGTTRTLVARNDAGEVLFTRTVPLVVLTAEEFTYRVFPQAGDESVYFDIIHTPTDHPEPEAPVAPVEPETPTEPETPVDPEAPGNEAPGIETPGGETPGDGNAATDPATPQDQAAGGDAAEDVTDAPEPSGQAPSHESGGEQPEADRPEGEALAHTGAGGALALGAAGLFALLGGAGSVLAARRRRIG